MSRYEFISYKEFPDQFTKAVITIRENLFDEKGKCKPSILNFGRREMKNGGVFWPNMSQGVLKDDGSKEYMKGHEPELKGDTLQLEEFVNRCAKAKGDPDLQVKPTSMSEVAANDALPF